MRAAAKLLLICCMLLITAHRLPAPIQEESPTPAAKAKSKRVTESRPNRNQKASTPIPKPSRRFAGTWSGTIQTFPPGPTATALTVDSSERTMTLAWKLSVPPAVNTIVIGNSMQATFGTGPAAPTFTLTPQPDGQTANVRMQAFMNDFNAVFHRASR